MVRLIEWIKSNKLLILLFAIGTVVRAVYAGAIPGGLNQDEASIGYEAYSILHYGMDRNGVTLPIHLVAWGSGQNALYAYLSIPFIYLFGLNPLSVRMVSLLFGLLGMVLFYLIAKRIFSSRQVVLAATFLIVICPWQMMISRWALESNIFPTLVLLAVYFLFKSFQQPRWLLGFTVALAASLYAYGTAYFFVPVFGLSVLVLLAVKQTIKRSWLAWNSVLLLLLAVPIGLFLFINRFDLSAIKLGISIPRLTEPRVETISTAFNDQPFAMLASHFKSFLNMYLSQADGLLWNAMPKFGYMYPLALPFIGIGILYGSYKLLKSFSLETVIIGLWFGTALLMTLITDVNINRINIIFYPTVFLAAAGLAWLHKHIKYALAVANIAFTVYFGLFCGQYFSTYAKQISPMFYESFGEAIQYASDATAGTVYVTDDVMMPYIYVLFYEQISPQQFMDTVEYINPGGAFQFVRSFGRYRFGQPTFQSDAEAAYIVSNTAPLPDEQSGYHIKKFKNYTVVSGEGKQEETTVHESFQNGGFEEGQQYWRFTVGAGVAENRPVSGTKLMYLDPGIDQRVSQTFVNRAAGEYSLSAMASTNAEGGVIGVLVNGVKVQEQAIGVSEPYAEIHLSAVSIAEQDLVTVYVQGGYGWVNIDEVDWTAH
ncbi:ArnT family glycosyltransferase [Paenibacillus sinopodophylli]|uniref:ArnT family glycosyltransferase n=1 Tax=Paenibacillus sinopodophylli TaxID=1837342 RepID=UPI00110C9A29|nr:glycosyltransferase family 39 protein [Paenibacillus sinopodophylli]